MKELYTLGIDFGSDSVRALVVNARDGDPAGVAVVPYLRWSEQRFCAPGRDQFRQHPLDYLESFEKAVREALKRAAQTTRDKKIGEKIAGLAVDTTGSTPCAVDRAGTPLALKKEFAKDPNAMFILWKDHTAKEEAVRINDVARSYSQDFTRYSGGVYSSEWFFSKILHVLRHDPKVRRAAFSWVEHCDWMSGLLTGNLDPLKIFRSRCAAGHKAMWHASWKGLPEQKFFSRVDVRLNGIRDRLYGLTFTADQCAGTLTREWAEKLGLNTDVKVAVGSIDAHVGAVGAGIAPGVMTKIIGTSTCDMVLADKRTFEKKVVRGICGQVDGSVLPGWIGLEAGQSSAGDALAWFRRVAEWGLKNISKVKYERSSVVKILDREAAKLKPGVAGLVALDWLNGRRTPEADPFLRGAFVGMHLGTSLPELYRSLMESVAFGARKIVDCFQSQDVRIDSILACGGLSQNDLVMQIHSDVLGKAIHASASDQTCALGAAIFASVASGIHADPREAQTRICPGSRKTFHPNARNHSLYTKLYQAYQQTGTRLEPVMHALSRVKEKS